MSGTFCHWKQSLPSNVPSGKRFPTPSYSPLLKRNLILAPKRPTSSRRPPHRGRDCGLHGSDVERLYRFQRRRRPGARPRLGRPRDRARPTPKAAGHRHRRQRPGLPRRHDRPHPGLRRRRQIPPRLEDPGQRQRPTDGPEHRQERPRLGPRHSLLSRAGVRSRRRAGRSRKPRRRHGPRPRRVRLGDRRRRG